MKLPTVVTTQFLKNLGACEPQVRLFRRTFGVRAAVTKENLRKAVDAGLSLWWLDSFWWQDMAKSADPGLYGDWFRQRVGSPKERTRERKINQLIFDRLWERYRPC